MSQGAGITELAAAFRVSRQTIYTWIDPEHKQFRRRFAQALEVGEELCEAWWLRVGRQAAAGKRTIMVSAWIFNMKNRFGWRDKIDLGSATDRPLRIEKKVYVIEGQCERIPDDKAD